MIQLITNIDRPPLRRSGCGVCLILVMLFLAGCAIETRVAPQPVVESLPGPQGPLVTRFEDGRKGFVITENIALDEDYRRDFEVAVTLLNDHDYEEAIALLEELSERIPDVTAPHINLALAYRQVDQPEAAEGHLKTALGLIPGHPLASNEYGMLLRKDGRFAEAKNVYERGIELFPEYVPLRRNLAILCDLYLNDQECALAQYEVYSEFRPEDEQAGLWLAEIRLRLGL